MDAEEALSQAFVNSDPAAIETLLSANVNVELPDKRHGMQTPLMRLCHLKNTEAPTSYSLLKLLLSRSPDVNARDARGCTAIAHACMAERADVIGELAKVAYCDPNLTDNGGNSPLIYAVRSRRPHIVLVVLEKFLSKGLDVNHANRKGMCALQEAELRHDEEICRLLIELGGADVTRTKASSVGKHGSRTPRCDTPDAKVDHRRGSLGSNPRRGSHPLSCEQLSPLITNGRIPVHVSFEVETDGVTIEYTDAAADATSTEGLAALLEEPTVAHNEALNSPTDAPTVSHRRRHNSLSLPDLNVTSSCKSLRVPALHSGHGGSADNICLSHEDVSLPLLCEVEEDDEVFATNGVDANCCNRKKSIEGGRQRNNSVSLPDLRQQASIIGLELPQISRHLPPRRRVDDGGTQRTAVQPDSTAVIDFLSFGGVYNPTGVAGGVLGLPRQNTSSQLVHSLPAIRTDRRYNALGLSNRLLGEHKWGPMNHRRQLDISPSRASPARKYRAESKTLTGLHLAGTKLKLTRSDN